MSPESLDTVPTTDVRRSLADKEVDLLTLLPAEVQADEEPLGATMARLAVKREVEALTPGLKSYVASLPVDFAVVLYAERTRFTPVLHVFREGQREMSRGIAQALPDHPVMQKVLPEALARGFASENFELTSTEVVVDGYRVRDVGVVVVPDSSCVIALLSRRLRPRRAEDVDNPGAWAPWDAYILNELRRGFHVSPLQLSDASFETELPDLLREYPGEWAAYHEDRRIGIFASKPEAERACLRQEVPIGEIYIRLIEEEPLWTFGWSTLDWS